MLIMWQPYGCRTRRYSVTFCRYIRTIPRFKGPEPVFVSWSLTCEICTSCVRPESVKYFTRTGNEEDKENTKEKKVVKRSLISTCFFIFIIFLFLKSLWESTSETKKLRIKRSNDFQKYYYYMNLRWKSQRNQCLDKAMILWKQEYDETHCVI